ncbi:FG-GAP-like repeat-containing protein [Xylanibacter brevis]|uniref:FG-GAP-like repeat-containing protein n=1 Tax=Xylanibacter brevis TaxID=83231 RepID=UPI0018CC3CC4|nr:FG-GAP-like repeat-containing protein [Xylanibacter brevis]
MKIIVAAIMSFCGYISSIASNDSTLFLPVQARNLAPVIDRSLPVGTIEGVAEVSLSGAATYQIPIAIPQGEYSYAPNLQIVYNSQAGEGLLGLGWNLAGTSVISRCGKSIYYDDKAEEVHMQQDDNIMLDGKRLILVSGGNLSSGAEYQLEDDPTAKVVFGIRNLRKGFILYLKDGSSREYGYAENSSLGDSGSEWLWLLNKATDSRGRSITYNYYIDRTNNEYCLKDIQYDLQRSVQFVYQSRPNTQTLYYAGKRILLTRQLKTLSTYYNGKRINEYKFGYANEDDFYSRLSDITFYGTDGSHYNSTHINYGSSSLESEFVAPFSQNKNGQRVHYGDFNGDGKTDFISLAIKNTLHNEYQTTDYIYVYLAKGNGENVHFERADSIQLGPYFRDVCLVDINGNGLCNIMVMFAGGDYTNNTIYEMEAGKLVSPGSIQIVTGRIFFGDFNGDGLKELLNGYNKKIYNQLGNVIGTAETINWNDYFSKKSIIPSTKLFCDVNGNGKEDVIVIGKDMLRVYELQDIVIQERTSFRNSDINSTQIVALGDFNGDGYMDIISQVKSGSVYNATLYHSTGTTFVPVSTMTIDAPVRVGDFNNDGRCDIMYKHPVGGKERFTIGISKGTSFVWSEHDSEKITPEDFENYQYNNIEDLYDVSDFDGDGLSDFGFFRGDSAAVILKFPNSQRNLVSDITDGIGKKTLFEYALSTDSSVCTSEDYLYYAPITRLSRPVNLVSRITLTDDDTSYSTSYKYDSPLVHTIGKGFLGFLGLTTTDQASGTVISSRFSLSMYTFHLHLGRRICATLDGETISDEGTNLRCVEYDFNHPRLYVPLILSQWSVDSLTGIFIRKEFTRDSYGNPIRTNTSYNGKLSETDEIIYENKTAGRWLIGQPSSIKKTLYNEAGNACWVSKDSIQYTYAGLPSRILKYTGDGTKQLQEEIFKYDNYGNISEYRLKPYTSPTQLVTKYEYKEDHSDVKTKTNPLSLSSLFTYDSYGRLRTAYFPGGNNYVYSYDSMGRRNKEQGSDTVSIVTSWQWADTPSNAKFVETISETGKPTLMKWYDAFNRELRLCSVRYDGSEQKVDSRYNSKGQLSEKSLPYTGQSPAYWDVYTYDKFGRIEEETYASGKNVRYAYDGRNVTTTSAGRSVTKTVNFRGELTKVSDSTGDIEYFLRPDGQPERILVQNQETTFGYDDYGRQTSINDPSSGFHSYTYNDSGLLASEIDADGRVVNITYDDYGRVKRKIRPEMTTTYDYDGLNRLSSVQSDNGSGKQFTYDVLGRIKSIKTFLPDDRFLQQKFTYCQGNVESIKYSNQSLTLGTERYTYTNGHLYKVTFDGHVVWQFQGENTMGMLSEDKTFGLTRSYTYDSLGRLEGLRMQSGNNVLMDNAYHTDITTGNLSWRKDNKRNKLESFGYDDIDRLITYNTDSVTYDNYGNIIRKSDIGADFIYGNADKPFAVTGISAGYNPSLLSSAEQRISYNSFENPDTIYDNGIQAFFTYDSDGNRVAMKSGSADMPTRYYVGSLYEEENLDDTTRYILYLGGDAYSAPAVCIVKGNEKDVFCIGRDHLGSITHIADQSGNLLYEYSYDVWGRLRDPSTGDVYPIEQEPRLFLGRGYCGHEHLTEFGIINMNGRLYDPALGRFVSPDSYVLDPSNSQCYNRYSYCLNNPLSYTDPDGENPLLVAAVVAGLVGGGVNLAANWNNCDGFLQCLAAFSVGAAAGASVLFTGGGSLGSIIATSAVCGAATSATNSIIAQTGENFSGMGSVDWELVGKGALSGGVAGAASGATGYWASKSSMVVNGIELHSPVVRSAVTSSLSSAMGHVAGGTAYGVLGGDNLITAFDNSTYGIWESVAIGSVIGVTSTVTTCYASKINPWNGVSNLSPYEKGCQGVDRAIAEFKAQGGERIQREVTIEVEGVRTRVDFMGYDKNKVLQLFEVKNGKYAGPTHNQRIVIPKLLHGASFTPHGANAARIGLSVRIPYTGSYVFNYIHYK